MSFPEKNLKVPDHTSRGLNSLLHENPLLGVLLGGILGACLACVIVFGFSGTHKAVDKDQAHQETIQSGKDPLADQLSLMKKMGLKPTDKIGTSLPIHEKNALRLGQLKYMSATDDQKDAIWKTLSPAAKIEVLKDISDQRGE